MCCFESLERKKMVWDSKLTQKVKSAALRKALLKSGGLCIRVRPWNCFLYENLPRVRWDVLGESAPQKQTSFYQQERPITNSANLLWLLPYAQSFGHVETGKSMPPTHLGYPHEGGILRESALKTTGPAQARKKLYDQSKCVLSTVH